MDLLQCYLEGWRKFVVFSGRSRRSEYACFVIGNILILLLAAAILVPNFGPNVGRFTLGPFLLATVLGHISLCARRLHDIGYTGWLTLLTFIPLVNLGLALVLFFWPSEIGHNQYGRYPTM